MRKRRSKKGSAKHARKYLIKKGVSPLVLAQENDKYVLDWVKSIQSERKRKKKGL